MVGPPRRKRDRGGAPPWGGVERNALKNEINKRRAEEGWLGMAELLKAWPVHPTDSTLRRVPSGVRARTENLDDGSVTGPKVAPKAIRQSEIATNSVGANELKSHGSDDSERSVTLDHCRDNLRNPGQDTWGLRSISNTLGGNSVQVSAGNHSHGSGNSSDFDLLPEIHQKRILLARQRVRNNVRNLDVLTTAQFRFYMRELSVVALAALALQIDAPDLKADERLAKREAGESVPWFTEWRIPENEILHDRTRPRYRDGLEDATVPE
jgi:hypothetical protein